MTNDEPVRVVPYDAEWPARFEAERVLIETAIGEWIVGGIHHVGSTAVPGLVAKPVIDILAGIRDLTSSRACFEPLERLRYLYAPYRADEMHWFCKPDPARRTHHLHLVPADSSRFRAELAFRNYLRSHPNAAGEYAALKSRLAERFDRDREAYTAGKVRSLPRSSGAPKKVRGAFRRPAAEANRRRSFGSGGPVPTSASDGVPEWTPLDGPAPT